MKFLSKSLTSIGTGMIVVAFSTVIDYAEFTTFKIMMFIIVLALAAGFACILAGTICDESKVDVLRDAGGDTPVDDEIFEEQDRPFITCTKSDCSGEKNYSKEFSELYELLQAKK